MTAKPVATARRVMIFFMVIGRGLIAWFLICCRIICSCGFRRGPPPAIRAFVKYFQLIEWV